MTVDTSRISLVVPISPMHEIAKERLGSSRPDKVLTHTIRPHCDSKFLIFTPNIITHTLRKKGTFYIPSSLVWSFCLTRVERRVLGSVQEPLLPSPHRDNCVRPTEGSCFAVFNGEDCGSADWGFGVVSMGTKSTLPSRSIRLTRMVSTLFRLQTSTPSLSGVFEPPASDFLGCVSTGGVVNELAAFCTTGWDTSLQRRSPGCRGSSLHLRCKSSSVFSCGAIFS